MKNQFVLLITLFCCLSLTLASCTGNAEVTRASAAAEINQPQPTTNQVVAEGRLVPGQNVDLVFASAGRIKEVLIKEGQTVEAGQLLARLEGSQNFQAQESAARLEIIQVEQSLRDLQDDAFLALAQASTELETAQKNYETAADDWNGDNLDHPTTFETALNDYIKAEEAVQKAQKTINDKSDAVKDSPERVQAEKDLLREQKRRTDAYDVIRSTFEKPQEGGEANTRTTLVNAIARLETARLRLGQLNGGPDPDLKAILEARLQAAQAAQQAALEGLRALEIHAPWSGVVVFWDAKVGQGILPEQPVGALANSATWFVETTDLTENSIVAIQVGAPVKITVNALPGETFGGIVESIQGKGEKYQGDMTYRIRILMDQDDPRWYWNMNVKITAGQ